MTTSPELANDYAELQALLEKRLSVIADTEFRDRDPDAHLEALKNVSEALMAKHAALKGRIPARLDHFLTQCSYQKALDYLAQSAS